jgi:glutamyl-tRNA synthetase
MSVVTRFAPSPTGYLHIGGARTALFNWLFARHHGGRFLLRIEDTDRSRHSEAAVEAIVDGLHWLGLGWDGEPVSQFAGRERHVAAAEGLMAQGLAYRCYCSPDELAQMRERARAEGRPVRYDGRCRDRDSADVPAGVAPAIRLKVPQAGETVIEDAVQGRVVVRNDQLDDMILLRADHTPTYMLAVVVDDIDMQITHVIRGDDHLTNAFRQTQLFQALGVKPPVFAHVPLIHGPDGTKLSKRHGAVGIEAYRDMGYLPETLRNYLLRLGWAHGDDEIISTDQAIAWFDLDGVGKAPARLDPAKLDHLNGHYMREADGSALVAAIAPRLAAMVGHDLGPAERTRLTAGMDGLKQRAKTLTELAENAAFYVRPRPLELSPKAANLLTTDAIATLTPFVARIAALAEWTPERLEAEAREAAAAAGVKLGQIAQPLRAALSGSTVSPGVFEVASVLGREEALGRLADAGIGIGTPEHGASD